MSEKIHQDIDNSHLYFDSEDKGVTKTPTLICECNGLGVNEIKSHFKMKKFDLEAAKSELGLGSGCNSCIKNLEEWIHLFKENSKGV